LPVGIGPRYVCLNVARPGRKSNDEHRTYEWSVRALGVLASFLVYLLFFSPSGIPKLRMHQATVAERADIVLGRIYANNDLQQRLDTLENDDRAFEEMARGRGFVRPGEIVLVLPETPDSSAN
jgi:cell division protein FtsB